MTDWDEEEEEDKREVVRPARKIEKMAPSVPPHESEVSAVLCQIEVRQTINDFC